MANSLASLGNGNCIEPFPNGTEGQVLTMDGGMPVWEDPSSGVSTDGSNILINGSDGKAYLTCEDVQDCVGLAIANGTGLTYDDALNAISATGVPITDGTGLPALGVLDTPTIYTDTSTGNVYYRDPAGVVVRLNTIFSVTSGPDAATVTSGPIDVDNGDTIHFWGNTIDFAVTPGSVRIQTEVALSADADNALITGTDGKLYVPVAPAVGISADGNQLLSLGSDGLPFLGCADLAGCSIDSLSDVDTTTTAPVSGDVLSFDGTDWVPLTPAAGHPAASVDATSNAALSIVAATQVVKLDLTAAGSYDNVTSGLTADNVQGALDEIVTKFGVSTDADQLLTLGSDGKPFMDCAALAGCSIDSLSDVDTTTTVPTTGQVLAYDGTNWVPTTKTVEKTTFGTEAGNAPAVPVAPTTAPAAPSTGDQYVEAYADKILVWEYDGAAWILRTTIPIAAGVNIYNADGTLTANRTVTMDGKSLTLVNATAVDTGTGMQNPNGTGHIRIDPSGDLEVGTSTAGSKVQLQANNLTVAQVLPAGIFEVDGDGNADQSGLRFKFLDDASPVTLTAAHLGVDASGNVVIAPDAIYEICAEADGTFDAGQRLRIPQESLAGCQMIAVDGPDCATATPASIALGYNGTTLGFFAMREKLPVRTVTASTAVNTLTDGVIVVDAAAGNVTVTLPTPGDCHPNHFYIKRIDTSANVVTIVAAATIDGAASIGLCNANALAKGNLTHVVWAGSAWITI